MTKWTAADLPDMAGRTVIITGATSGIGLVTARELARAGARVTLAVRDYDKGRLTAATMPGNPQVRRLDVADLDSVRAFARDWDGGVDILINNAGIMQVPLARTADGFESQAATNFLGPFALTSLLLPQVTDRIVTVSSQLHRRGRLHADDLNWDGRRYNRAPRRTQPPPAPCGRPPRSWPTWTRSRWRRYFPLWRPSAPKLSEGEQMEFADEKAAAAPGQPEAATGSPLIADVPPGKPAVVMADGSGLVTYGEMEARSRQVARLLASLGVRGRDQVAIMLPNRPEYFEIAWGAQRAGTYWTPVNWHLTAEEAAYIIADCGATILFASPETAKVAAQVPGLQVFVTGDDPGLSAAGLAGNPRVASYEAAIEGLSTEPIEAEVEGSTVFYSSGTTGRPKGIRRTAEFLPFGTGAPLDQVMQLLFGFGADSLYLCPGPLYHAAPLGFSMGTHRAGGTVVLMDRFDPAGCLRAIEAHQVTHTQFVPTHFVRMLRLPEPERRAFDLSSLRIAIHAAAPCPAEVKRQMIDWLGPVIWEYYAGSEGNGMTIIGTEEWLAHPGSVGRAISGALHILDEDGTERPAGEDGLIYFDGAAFEYHNDPDKTAGSRNEAGWSTLGDIGHLDAEGYLFLSDRRTDLIISGGVNLYPREIEEALIGHPAVADVAVIGLPDPEMGQSVLAIVQPSAPDTGSPALAAELIAHCRERLASFKCPRAVEFVAALPRTPTGKLLRRQLRAERQPG